MIGVSAVKNGELLDLRPQDVTLTIGENVLTSDKLINGYVVFDYSQGRTPVSEIVKVTILDTQFELLIVGKFSSKGDVGGSGGVAEETDPVFVEKCLSADSIALGNGASANYNESIAIGKSTNAAGDNSIAIGNGANSHWENSIAIGNGIYTAGNNSIAIGYLAHPYDNSIAIGVEAEASDVGTAIGYNAKCGYNSIALGYCANTNS